MFLFFAVVLPVMVNKDVYIIFAYLYHESKFSMMGKLGLFSRYVLKVAIVITNTRTQSNAVLSDS